MQKTFHCIQLDYQITQVQTIMTSELVWIKGSVLIHAHGLYVALGVQRKMVLLDVLAEYLIHSIQMVGEII